MLLAPRLLYVLFFLPGQQLKGYQAFPFVAWAKSYHLGDNFFSCSFQMFFNILLFLAPFKRRTNVKTREIFHKVKLPIFKPSLTNFPFWLPPQSWSSLPLALLGRADEVTARSEHKFPPSTSCIWRKWHIANPVRFFNPRVAWIQQQDTACSLKLD